MFWLFGVWNLYVVVTVVNATSRTKSVFFFLISSFVNFHLDSVRGVVLIASLNY
jgi:hypothetical protein